MTGNKNCFVSLDENIKSHITLGDGSHQDVAGKGTIAVRAKNGSTKFIQDALYVPGLAQNLLSVGQLLQRGYMVKFDENRCLIHDKKRGELIAFVTMAHKKIFPLMMPLEHKVALTTTIESTKL